MHYSGPAGLQFPGECEVQYSTSTNWMLMRMLMQVHGLHHTFAESVVLQYLPNLPT